MSAPKYGQIATAIKDQIARLSDPTTSHVFRQPANPGECCAVAYFGEPGNTYTTISDDVVDFLDSMIEDYTRTSDDEDIDGGQVAVTDWNDYGLNPLAGPKADLAPVTRRDYDAARWRLLLFLDEGLSAALELGV